MKVRALVSMLLVALVSAGSLAAESADKVQTLLDQSAKAKRYHQNTLMTMDMMGNKMEMAGEMWVDGQKMRVEMTMQPMNSKQIIVSDGDMTYTYMPMMKMVQKMDMKRIKAALGDDFNKGMMGTGTEPNPYQGVDKSTLKWVGTEDVDGETLEVLEGKIEAPSEDMQQAMPMMPEKAKFCVSSKDGLPRKIVFYGKSGQEMMSQKFSNVEVDPDMDAALFTFEAPEGAQEVDMTEGVINMYQEMKKPGQSPAPAEIAE